MLISLAAVAVARDVWISNITDEDVIAFGQPQTTGFGSHVLRLKRAELNDKGLLTFERRDALFVRRGRADEAILFRDFAGPNSIITHIGSVVLPNDDVYGVTVGSGRQENFEIGMRNGVWGVPPEYGTRLEGVSHATRSSSTAAMSVLRSARCAADRTMTRSRCGRMAPTHTGYPCRRR